MNSSCFLARMSDTDEEAYLYNRFSTVLNSGRPLDSMYAKRFVECDGIDLNYVVGERSLIPIDQSKNNTIYLPSQLSGKMIASCPISQACYSASKITACFSCNKPDFFTNNIVNIHEIFSYIILQSTDEDNMTTIYDILNPYFLDVYHDCFIHDKESYKLVTKPGISFERDMFAKKSFESSINLPLPLFFDRQNAPLYTGNAKYSIDFLVSHKFYEEHKTLFDANAFSVKLFIRTKICYDKHYSFDYSGITPKSFYCESIMSYEPRSFGVKTNIDHDDLYKCFYFKENFLCKNKFFSIIERASGKNVTKEVVKLVTYCFGMAVEIQASIKDITVTQHFHAGIIPNENYILIDFGGAKFSNVYEGSCVHGKRCNEHSLCIEFNCELEDGKYELIGFQTVVKDYEYDKEKIGKIIAVNGLPIASDDNFNLLGKRFDPDNIPDTSQESS